MRVNIPSVREELTVREGIYDEKDGIKVLVLLLKAAVKNKDGRSHEKSFHPRTNTLQQQFDHSILYTN